MKRAWHGYRHKPKTATPGRVSVDYADMPGVGPCRMEFVHPPCMGVGFLFTMGPIVPLVHPSPPGPKLVT